MSTFPRRVTRSFIRLILLLVFVAIPAAVTYLGFVGLPGTFTRQVARAMSGAEYEVRIERIRLNLLRGFVALGIDVTNLERVPLLEIDRLAVAINLSDLLHQRIRVESLELNRASLRIPVGQGNKISVEQVSARIFLPHGQLRIPLASGILKGIHLEVEGNFLHPLAFDPTSLGGGDEETTADFSKRILEVLREIRFEETPSSIRMVVSGDMADLRSISLDSITMNFNSARWREVEVQHLQAVGSYRAGVFTLENLLLLSKGTSLHAAGEFSDRTRAGQLLLRGTIYPLPWLRSLGMEKFAEDWQMPNPLHVELQASKVASNDTRPSWQVLGSVDLEDFQYRSVPVKFLGADFAWQPGLFLTRDAKIQAPSMDGTLHAKVAEKTASVRAAGTFNPTLCLPWLDAGMQRVVSEMTFADPARAEIALEIPLEDSSSLTGSGVLKLGRTAMRGAWIEAGSAELSLGDRAVEYKNIDLRMDGGRGSGDFVYDFGRREVRLRNIVSTVPPEKILLWIDEKIADAVKPYRWRVPPSVRCAGTVDMADPGKTSLAIKIDAPQGLDYELLGRDLSFTGVKGNVSVRGRQLEAEVLQALLFKGAVTLQTTVSLDHRNPTYQLETTLRGVDFAAINQLYFGYNGSDGELSADFSYTAEFARQTELVGRGWIRVENGNVFAIPVLGPLSSLLGNIIPGAGYQTSRLATADFTVENEIIRTENLEIVGSGFSLFGEGDIHFVADELDMSVRLNAQGTPGLVLMPVSKLFEYVGTGPVGNPQWRPRNIPKEVTPEGLIETVTNPVRQFLTGENGLFPSSKTEAHNSPENTSTTRPKRKNR